MIRPVAILLACLMLFVTSGAHRAAASWFDTTVTQTVVTMDRAVEQSTAPCCKSYKIHKDHQTSACSLPTVMLPTVAQLESPKSRDENWSIPANNLHRGHLCGPGEQPPKSL